MSEQAHTPYREAGLDAKAINTIIAKHFAPLVPDMVALIGAGTKACREILALTSPTSAGPCSFAPNKGRTEPMSVEITQADREAAAAIFARDSTTTAQMAILGDYDRHPIVQAFAKHRSTSTEEVERLREALEPSGATKAAYHGDFAFDLYEGVSDAGIDQHRKVYVPWDTVKEIMAAIRNRAALGATSHVE